MHKAHWDAIDEFYASNKKRYNSIEEAKIEFDVPIRKYIKTIKIEDPNYLLKNISINCDVAFREGNYNEFFADAFVRYTNRTLEPKVLELYRRVMGYDETTY